MTSMQFFYYKRNWRKYEKKKKNIYIYIYWPRKQHDDYNMHVQKSSKFHEHAMIAHIDIHYSMSGCSFSGFARYGWYYY